jgi:hypothetical protein
MPRTRFIVSHMASPGSCWALRLTNAARPTLTDLRCGLVFVVLAFASECRMSASVRPISVVIAAQSQFCSKRKNRARSLWSAESGRGPRFSSVRRLIIPECGPGRFGGFEDDIIYPIQVAALACRGDQEAGKEITCRGCKLAICLRPGAFTPAYKLLPGLQVSIPLTRLHRAKESILLLVWHNPFVSVNGFLSLICLILDTIATGFAVFQADALVKQFLFLKGRNLSPETITYQ